MGRKLSDQLKLSRFYAYVIHLGNKLLKQTGSVFDQTEKGKAEEESNGMGVVADSDEMTLRNQTEVEIAHKRVKRSTGGTNKYAYRF